MQTRIGILPFVLLAAASGCTNDKSTATSAVPYAVSGYGEPSFKDDAKTNTDSTGDLASQSFVDSAGNVIELAKYRGKKNVVLVVTRGWSNAVCPYCAAQTSSLAGNYAEFAKRDTEVLVVFPGASDHVGEFLSTVNSKSMMGTLPFPLVLDRELKFVDWLGIRADLAKPSTYIVDKQGKVRFAYVGATTADRPSVKAMLAQLDMLKGP